MPAMFASCEQFDKSLKMETEFPRLIVLICIRIFDDNQKEYFYIASLLVIFLLFQSKILIA